MTGFIKRLIGCTRREARVDAISQQQADEHSVAMRIMDSHIAVAEASAEESVKTSERAAQVLLRHLREDIR